ncbi:tail fiber protein [Yersinia phage Yep-phi]|uniref:Tail fiber protein n=2 Tax=Berlinvirus Yepf TaxID=2732789 RepID=E5L7F4_9CAUD|nr:phage tail fiber protein [Yersinia pestis]YP_009014859.1 tail fiber protein [Yersinia phage Yep-phi]QTI27946.1 non-contractile tail fiber protein [Yersinia phage vB_YpP-YepMm]ADQ83192.1 tail fiber protein [Yersinia phage Yep-phi]MBD3443830.1 hypothetical protein [Yersinia pestis]MBD3451690.1 hypothetical protein [Yersinia pestis]
MANKISTVRTYPLNGSVNFTITFEYLARKFVLVTLIGKDRKELVLNQDYRFTAKTQITTARAWTAADGYEMIEIRRFTSATDRLVDFADGSILRAYDLNISQIQTIHVAEEARDLTADTIGVNNDGNLDARGRKIVNLAFATSDYDAVPLKQITDRESSVWNAVTKASEQADRSNKEANRSRDEADRAKREADRSTQQAGVSATQAVEAKKQADRSNSEANRSKGYADSMTASVEAAKGHAESASKEANRSRAEANRAADEVTKAAAEVSKAAAHVASAKNQADRSSTEANRAKSEADRAKTEADKLGNINEFAGTLEKVEGVTPTFKSGIKLRSGDFYAESGSFTKKTQGGDWSQWTGALTPDVQHDIEGQGNIAYLLERATTLSKEPLYAKCLYNNGVGENFFIRQYLRDAHFDLRADGALISSSGWSIPADGNLYIKKYGSNLDTWVNKRLSAHAYSKGEVNKMVDGLLTTEQGDARYARKSSGWTEVWQGSAGGGVSVSLSQDVRWRTIWILANNGMCSVQIGADATYFMVVMGGWLKFTISNNGRTFRNDQDRNTVPEQILVRN